MKTAGLVLCVVTVTSAVPVDFLSGLLRQNSQATGSAAGNVVTGTSGGPFQNSHITQVSARAGGSASGNAISTNSASASNINVSGIFGNQQLSNTNAVSNQQTFDGIFNGGFQQPYQQPYQRPYQRPCQQQYPRRHYF